jgi:hypothetical protein
MFFSRFNKIQYDGAEITDLSVGIIIPAKIRDNKDLFFWYQIADGDTPDSLASDFYRNSHYNFVILLMNNIVDPLWDWPLSTRELIEFCESKYGVPTITNGKYDSNGYFAVKHWVGPDGLIYQDGTEPIGSGAVSFYEYEEELNQSRRKIKMLHPELIPNFKRELDFLFSV